MKPFLIGEKVYLRAIEASDIDGPYLDWLNDVEVTLYMETGRFPSTSATLRKYLERFDGSSTDVIFAICDKKTDKHIGTATLNSISWIHRTANTGIMIGDKAYWGKGYAYEAWKFLIDYSFSRLGLRKITAGAVVDNIASIKLQEKLGFKIEGTFKEQVMISGTYHDTVLLGLFHNDFYNAKGEQR